MATKPNKIDNLYLGPDREARWLKCELEGLAALAHKERKAWYVLPSTKLPFKTGTRRLRDGLLVTEYSLHPVSDRNRSNTITESYLAMAAVANVRATFAGTKQNEESRFVHLSLAMMAAALSIIALVVLIGWSGGLEALS